MQQDKAVPHFGHDPTHPPICSDSSLEEYTASTAEDDDLSSVFVARLNLLVDTLGLHEEDSSETSLIAEQQASDEFFSADAD